MFAVGLLRSQADFQDFLGSLQSRNKGIWGFGVLGAVGCRGFGTFGFKGFSVWALTRHQGLEYRVGILRGPPALCCCVCRFPLLFTLFSEEYGTLNPLRTRPPVCVFMHKASLRGRVVCGFGAEPGLAACAFCFLLAVVFVCICLELYVKLHSGIRFRADELTFPRLLQTYRFRTYRQGSGVSETSSMSVRRLWLRGSRDVGQETVVLERPWNPESRRGFGVASEFRGVGFRVCRRQLEGFM